MEPESFLVDSRLNVIDFGEASGVQLKGMPCLMVHGFTQTCWSFEQAAKLLKTRGTRVFSMDLRGHGESHWDSGGDYSRASMVNDIALVLQSLPYPSHQVVLIAMSMGAALSTTLATQVQVRSLVVIDWAPWSTQGPSEGVEKIAALFQLQWDNMEQAVETMVAHNNIRTPAEIRSSLTRQLRYNQQGKLVWNTDPAIIGDAGVRAQEPPSVMWNTVARVQVPTLVIRGAQSRVLDPERAQRLADTFMRGHLVTIPNAGHSVAGDNPTAFVEAVAPLMSRSLFDPVWMGDLRLSHKVVMAPLTRMRCANRLPDERVAEYYSQRATPGGLLISEGVHPSFLASNGVNTPLLFNERHAEAWRHVCDAVHAKGGLIAAQLWHCGRQSHSAFHGEKPISSGAVTMRGKVMVPGQGLVEPERPRALLSEEIPLVIQQFRRSAEAAKLAGFDAIELHGANGYLVDQFLAGNVNQRGDAYGKDRTLFLRHIVEQLIEVYGAGRVGVRLAPGGSYGDCWSEDAPKLFESAAALLSSMGVAYLHLVEPGTQGSKRQNSKYPGDHRLKDVAAKLRSSFQGPIILCGLQTKSKFQKNTSADAIAFGRPFISNPDLVERLRRDAPLQKPKKGVAFFYGDYIPQETWSTGYTDYLELKLNAKL